MTTSERWLLRRWLTLNLLTALPVLAVIICGIYLWNTRPPAAFIPMPILPDPNGFTLLEKAGKEVRPHAQAVTRLLDGTARPGDPTPQGLLNRYRGQLALVRQGLKLRVQAPPARSWRDLFPYLSDFRTLNGLFCLEAREAARQGRLEDATGSCLDALLLSVSTARGGVVIHSLTAIRLEQQALEELRPLLPRLSATGLKSLAARLSEIARQRVAPASVLTEEKYCGQAVLLELLESPQSFLDAQRELGIQENAYGVEPGLYRLALTYFLRSKQQIYDNYTGYMDEVIRAAGQPYSRHSPEVPEPEDPVSQFLLPVFTGLVFSHWVAECKFNLLLTACVLRAYYLEQGQYPDSLSRLEKPLPGDPFARNAPPRYEAKKDSFLLYSIGPDAVDNGGKAIGDSRKKQAKERFQIKLDSQGDIVFAREP